jgi:hypothetical protein
VRDWRAYLAVGDDAEIVPGKNDLLEARLVRGDLRRAVLARGAHGVQRGHRQAPQCNDNLNWPPKLHASSLREERRGPLRDANPIPSL